VTLVLLDFIPPDRYAYQVGWVQRNTNRMPVKARLRKWPSESNG